jgi:flavin-dependent dehydrogenase
MSEQNDRIEIAGAGPAGLTAALTIAGEGRKPIVYERRKTVGDRFHGDFQGLENWSSETDVIEELKRIGIEPTFDYTPVNRCMFWSADEKQYRFESEDPLWYLVRRGSGEGTLDHALQQQVRDAGITIRTGETKKHLPEGGIVTHGPRRADVIATGYVFDTSMEDGCYSILSDELAPSGYAYLLIVDGHGTIATCLFDDFHSEKMYLDRTVEAFHEKLDLEMKNQVKFGGYGNVFMDPEVRKGNLLYAGEAAGFQDALFGFGMRYAIRSGHYAGRALATGAPELYEDLCDEHLRPMQKRSVVNRYLFNKVGDWGYKRLLNSIDNSEDPREWMNNYYSPNWLKNMLYPIARNAYRDKKNLVRECKDDCTCTFCQCERDRQE